MRDYGGEIDYALTLVDAPGCDLCGCVHDDKQTKGRRDSCYREMRPFWMHQASGESSVIIRLLLRRLNEARRAP